MKIEPKKYNMKIKGVLGKYNIVGTVYVLTKKSKLQKLEEMINEKIEEIRIYYHLVHQFYQMNQELLLKFWVIIQKIFLRKFMMC